MTNQEFWQNVMALVESAMEEGEEHPMSGVLGAMWERCNNELIVEEYHKDHEGMNIPLRAFVLGVNTSWCNIRLYDADKEDAPMLGEFEYWGKGRISPMNERKKQVYKKYMEHEVIRFEMINDDKELIVEIKI